MSGFLFSYKKTNLTRCKINSKNTSNFTHTHFLPHEENIFYYLRGIGH
jgi:hypothetical protein